TSKNGQGGPSVQSGQDADSSVVVIVQLEESADGEATLASINEAVAASFPGASVSVEREYRNALRGYALRVPAGSLETIRAVGGVQAAYPDGNNRLH
ncbi:MAG: protease inhibitor I9 family protein, partial [Schaalia sp.]|nr:protease inhibitor I9 family protein [Schaalia sp.]